MPRLRPCEPRIEWKWRNLYRSATQPTVGFRLPCPSCAPPSAPSEGVFVAAPAPPSRGTGGRGLFDELLEAEDVARWAGVDTGTAYRWASEGTGPRQIKLGGAALRVPARVPTGHRRSVGQSATQRVTSLAGL